MGLLDFFKKSNSKLKKKGVGPLADDSTIFKTVRQVIASAGSTIAYPYKESVWIFSCVETIADNISRVPFVLYYKVKDPKNPLQREAVQEGQLYDVFANPNPLMTYRQLIKATMTYLELKGEAFWILDRKNVTEIPKEIWTFDPSRFTEIIDEKKRQLIGWKYRRGSEEIPFALHEVLFFRYFNPYNDIRGVAPYEAAKLSVEQDYFASEHNKNFFEEGAVLSGFIRLPQDDTITTEEYNRMLNQFEDRHKGYRKAHRIGILEGGADWIRTMDSPKDLDFVNLKNMTRQEIFSAYGVNEVVLGIFDEIQSYEGVRAAMRSFWQETLIPKISYLEEVINKTFLNKIAGKYFGEFDLGAVEALRDDYNYKVQTAWFLFRMGYPINMINKRLGLGMDEVKWGDVWWAQSTLIPVNEDGVVTGKSQETPLPNKEEESLKPPLVAQKIMESCNLLDRKFQSKLSRFFFEERKAVIEALYAVSRDYKIITSSDLIESIFPAQEQEIEKLRNLLQPLYMSCAKVGAESLASETNDASFIFNESDFKSIVSSRLEVISTEIVLAVKAQLSQSLVEGINASDSTEDLIERVRKVYNFVASKARQLSKTESIGVINSVRYCMMQNYNITKHKWVYLGNSACRHRFYNNKIVKIGESFDDTISLIHPCDLSSLDIGGCSCITVPVPQNGN